MDVVAIGVVPEAVGEVEIEQKTRLGKLAYVISGVKHLKDAQDYSFTLTLDGKKEVVETSTIVIGMTNSVGGVETALTDAKTDDGKFHLIYVKDKSILGTLKAVPEILKGVDQSTGNVAYRTFSQGEIKVTTNERLVTNVDGDKGDYLPITLQILPQHLTVYCG